MKRLTKNENGTYLLNIKLNLHVLAQLEYRYVWFKDLESGEFLQASPERVSISLYKKDLSVDAGPKGTYFLYFKDYGKVWAFERDELE